MNRELADVRDEIKRTVTMDQVLQICNINPPKGNSRKINSPFNPGDRTPSCHIYDYDWYDYSTGQGGDQITFVQEYMGISYTQALQVLGRGTTAAVVPRRNPHDMPWEPADLTDKFHDEPADNWDYYKKWQAFVAEKWPYLGMYDIFMTDSRITKDGELWTPHWVPDPDTGERS